MGKPKKSKVIVIGRDLITSKAYLSLKGVSPQLLMLFLARRRLEKHGRRGKKKWVCVNASELVFTYSEAKKRFGISNQATGLLKTILPPKSCRNLNDPDQFPVDERDLFLETAEATCSRQEAMLLKVMAFAGFRLGEVLAMRREHLSESRQTYYVAQSFKRGRYGRPKSGKMRLVDLPGFLVADLLAYIGYLKKERLRAGQGGRIDILFPDPSEKWRQPISQRKVQGLVKRVCKAAGLRARSPHDLRHTYASILLMAHESPGYVQRQMGHSSISITMDIYCHWIPGEGRQNLEKALLAGGKTAKNVVQNLHFFAPKKKTTPVSN